MVRSDCLFRVCLARSNQALVINMLKELARALYDPSI